MFSETRSTDSRFTHSMFTSTINSSWNERSRRGLTTLTSFGLQALACAALLVLPLLRPMRLPLLRPLSTPVTLGQPLAEAPTVRTHASANAAATNTPAIFIFRAPARIPTGIPTSGDDGPPQVGPSGPDTGALGPGRPDGLLSVLGTGTRPVLSPQPVTAAPPVRISHMDEGNLVHKVLPVYPSLARTARIQGQVVLQALISKQGVIENLKVLSGHPMLAPAAKEAVRQWRYRPYVLNNEPVEVETQITVNFSLAGN
jgi:periplasmic protein TonB